MSIVPSPQSITLLQRKPSSRTSIIYVNIYCLPILRSRILLTLHHQDRRLQCLSFCKSQVGENTEKICVNTCIRSLKDLGMNRKTTARPSLVRGTAHCALDKNVQLFEDEASKISSRLNLIRRSERGTFLDYWGNWRSFCWGRRISDTKGWGGTETIIDCWQKKRERCCRMSVRRHVIRVSLPLFYASFTGSVIPLGDNIEDVEFQINSE